MNYFLSRTGVDFVNLHLSWEHAETFSVEFYLHGKVG